MTTAAMKNSGDWHGFASDMTFSPHLSPLHAAGHVAKSSATPHEPQCNGERDTRQEGFKGPSSGNEPKLCAFFHAFNWTPYLNNKPASLIIFFYRLS